MTAAREMLIPGDEFQTSSFSVEKYRPLEKVDTQFRLANHALSQYLGDVGTQLSPRESLIRYASSPSGAWQALQRARYPILHADLPAEISDVDADDPESLQEFRHTMLRLISHPERTMSNVIDNTHRYGNQAIDFHPIGHMAQAALRQDRWLMLDQAATSVAPDPFYLQVARHTAALHDAGEAEFPGVKLYHGAALGDVGANIGKTQEQRTLEKSILSSVINAHYSDSYTSEFQQALVDMAAHDISPDNKLMKQYHDVLEANHEINTIHTGIYLAEKAELATPKYPAHANIMMALAFDSLLRAIKKRDKLTDAGMNSEIAHSITRRARILYEKATARDDDEVYTTWRKRDVIVERFGDYNPTDPIVLGKLN